MVRGVDSTGGTLFVAPAVADGAAVASGGGLAADRPPPCAPVRTVLFVDDSETLAGAELSLLVLLEHLDRDRFSPVLACAGGPLAAEARALGVPVFVVPLPKVRSRPPASASMLLGSLALAGVIRRLHVHLVHANVLRAALYAASAARLTGRPLVWHVRDIFAGGPEARLLSRVCARAVAVSNAAAASSYDQGKVRVVHPGVDAARFEVSGEEFRAELGLDAGTPLVGIVGPICPWKGQGAFLHAATLVTGFRPDARFVVVGDVHPFAPPAHLPNLRLEAQVLGVADRVTFTGHRRDIPAVMAALDLLVSATDEEPFGSVLVEAMAAGTPVVAYRSGAVPEIVSDGETGLLVDPGDTAAIAAAVVRLLDDPLARSSMAVAGRVQVRRRFAAARAARAIEAVYDEVLA